VAQRQKKDERKKVDVNWKASHSDADGKQENMAGYFNDALPIPLSHTPEESRIISTLVGQLNNYWSLSTTNNATLQE